MGNISEKIETLVNNHVYTNQSALVEELLKNETLFKLDEIRNFSDDQDGEYPEIYEWYAISSRLCDKLQGIGATVIDNEY
jgi:hypothetical protein